ncbi:MAG: hypothetical protein KAI59_06710 [Planctomycetes bacterium]|nr:hypothetical protein [Planctomycetota bacterium]
MIIKDLWLKTSSWLQNHRPLKTADYQPQIGNDGLISQNGKSIQSTVGEENGILVKTANAEDKTQSIEKLQAGFNKLIEQLQGINEHLNCQVSQHENLMSQMSKLPELLESFPNVVENQKQLSQQLFEQLKANVTKEHQFIDAVEKIPTETAKQTDALIEIDHQLAAAANVDAQIAGNFNKFNETLDKLNQSTVSQTDGIMQMSKTFSASDRYLKYIISRQNKRFMWIFVTAIGVCLFAILLLTGIIIYLKQ